MSVEEGNELKNLVAQTLENKGILPKIRAELRANVFLALEENPATKETLLRNDKLSAFVKIPLGTLVLNLIRECLEFFELEFTLSVFDPETKYGKEYNTLSRDKLLKELKLTDSKNKCPLLYEIIEKVINFNEPKVIHSEKTFEINQGDASGGGDFGYPLPSPTGLNSTYVKPKSEGGSIPVSPIEKEEIDSDEIHESIKEELVLSNISDSDNLSDSKLGLDKNMNQENADFSSATATSKDPKLNSPCKVPKESFEIDLLTFTPVKETKSKEATESATLPSSNETKTDDKEKKKSMSILGDLPPLTLNAEEKIDKMNEIKAIIDKWPDSENDEESLHSKDSKDQINEDKSSPQIHSERSDYSQNMSQKSDKTGVDDFEEDISDLINGHTPLDSQVTLDETISKASGKVDYMESL